MVVCNEILFFTLPFARVYSNTGYFRGRTARDKNMFENSALQGRNTERCPRDVERFAKVQFLARKKKVTLVSRPSPPRQTIETYLLEV